MGLSSDAALVCDLSADDRLGRGGRRATIEESVA
jgi:hypothetical protein